MISWGGKNVDVQSYGSWWIEPHNTHSPGGNICRGSDPPQARYSLLEDIGPKRYLKLIFPGLEGCSKLEVRFPCVVGHIVGIIKTYQSKG